MRQSDERPLTAQALGRSAAKRPVFLAAAFAAAVVALGSAWLWFGADEPDAAAPAVGTEENGAVRIDESVEEAPNATVGADPVEAAAASLDINSAWIVSDRRGADPTYDGSPEIFHFFELGHLGFRLYVNDRECGSVHDIALTEDGFVIENANVDSEDCPTPPSGLASAISEQREWRFELGPSGRATLVGSAGPVAELELLAETGRHRQMSSLDVVAPELHLTPSREIVSVHDKGLLGIGLIRVSHSCVTWQNPRTGSEYSLAFLDGTAAWDASRNSVIFEDPFDGPIVLEDLTLYNVWSRTVENAAVGDCPELVQEVLHVKRVAR